MNKKLHIIQITSFVFFLAFGLLLVYGLAHFSIMPLADMLQPGPIGLLVLGFLIGYYCGKISEWG